MFLEGTGDKRRVTGYTEDQGSRLSGGGLDRSRQRYSLLDIVGSDKLQGSCHSHRPEDVRLSGGGVVAEGTGVNSILAGVVSSGGRREGAGSTSFSASLSSAVVNQSSFMPKISNLVEKTSLR